MAIYSFVQNFRVLVQHIFIQVKVNRVFWQINLRSFDWTKSICCNYNEFAFCAFGIEAIAVLASACATSDLYFHSIV